MNNLLTLISVMGSGYVAKLNARVGHVRALANVVIWATCNDETIIQKFRNGALWSRFVHKFHCPRPSRALMEKILLERVCQSGGNPEWARAAIEFAYETMKIATGQPWDDPREIIGLLDGGDRLLTGQYQKDILEIIRGEIDERLAYREDIEPEYDDEYTINNES